MSTALKAERMLYLGTFPWDDAGEWCQNGCQQPSVARAVMLLRGGLTDWRVCPDCMGPTHEFLLEQSGITVGGGGTFGPRERKPIPVEAEAIRRLYWDAQLTIAEVGDELGYTEDQVHGWMRRLQIPRRTRSQSVSLARARGRVVDPRCLGARP